MAERAVRERGVSIRLACEIFQEIDDVVQAVSARGGYDLVLNKRVLLFQKKDFDITPQVSTELAKKYNK